MNMQRARFWSAILCTVMAAGTANADEPTFADVAYDDAHAAQRLDVYLAKTEKPAPVMIYIHGGAWRAGSKKHVPQWLHTLRREAGIAVVSVEYRFTDVATHPAQVNDCLRAVQFVRHRATAWNIDPTRVGVTGGSAGGHLSAYVALHDDVADRQAQDAVARLSSRVRCAVSFAGPTDWSLLKRKEIAHTHPAYRQLIGYEPKTPVENMAADRLRDVSPISFVSKDDPPVMQVHGSADQIVPVQHAESLHKRLQSAGVTAELVVIEGAKHNVAGASEKIAERPTAFVRKYLASP
ncbi:MAG: hypothetical protein CL681_02895 [Blastopirellula sp.]|nr:hypothetical protein [Blastopirellula sp.]